MDYLERAESFLEQEAESGVNEPEIYKGGDEGAAEIARARALCELEEERVEPCEEGEPKARRELLMAECRRWWHALLDKDKWIRDQDQGLVEKVVLAIQRRFPELSIPAVRAIIARSMRKAREKAKIATTRVGPTSGNASEEDVPLSSLRRPPSKGKLELLPATSPTMEFVRTAKLPQMSDSATSSGESAGGRKRQAEPTPWDKNSCVRVKNETWEPENRSPTSGTTSDESNDNPPGGIPVHLRLPFDIPPAPRFKGGPGMATPQLKYPPPSTSYAPSTQTDLWAAVKSGRPETTEEFLARAAAASPCQGILNTKSTYGVTDDIRQRIRALELLVAQLQARESTWQAEKLGFEWHVQKLEAGELRAREGLAQAQARAEGLERELQIKALANADLERQVRTLAMALRGSDVQLERPTTPAYQDFNQIDQQQLLPALLMAYQKICQGGHVSKAHMHQMEGQDQTRL